MGCSWCEEATGRAKNHENIYFFLKGGNYFFNYLSIGIDI